MHRRSMIALSTMSAASLAVGAGGIFEAWRYRRLAIGAELESEANAAALRQLATSTRQTAQALEARRQEGRDIVTKLVGLDADDSLRDIGYRLTDILYQTNDDWSRDDRYSSPELSFVMAVVGPAGNLCSGLSRNLHWALDRFAVPNRFIIFAAQSFLDGKQLGDTHELIEAKLDGQVMVLDPTFSVTYCNGDDPTPIDARTMVACAKAGTLRAQAIGKSRPGRGLADYYLPIEKLAVAMQATGGGPGFYQQEIPYPGWFAKTMAKYQEG